MKANVTRRLVTTSCGAALVGAGILLVAPAAPAAPAGCDATSHHTSAPCAHFADATRGASAITAREAPKGSTRPTSNQVAGTGADQSTRVLGLLGAGLGSGAIASVVVNRRRRHAARTATAK